MINSYASLEDLKRENAALRSALEDLYAEQNGPPVITKADRWQAAMDGAEAALGERLLPVSPSLHDAVKAHFGRVI